MIGTIVRLLALVSVFVFCFCVIHDNKYPSIKNLHQTVILDQSMTDEDIDAALAGMREWECSTNNIVQFTVIKYPSEQELAGITDLDHSLIMRNIDINDQRLDDKNANMPKGTYTVALYVRNGSGMPEILIGKLFLVPHSKEYKLYVEHELGHSLGLPHIANVFSPEVPIMDPVPSHSNGITNDDLILLAQEYNIPLISMHVCR